MGADGDSKGGNDTPSRVLAKDSSKLRISSKEVIAPLNAPSVGDIDC